jgi:ankyrin repeat protein
VRFDRVGDNVLHNAVLCQKLDMISKLLRMGMDPTASAPNSLNGSPLDLAKKDTSSAGKKIYELLTRTLTSHWDIRSMAL